MIWWKNDKNANFCIVVTKTVNLFVIVRNNITILDMNIKKTLIYHPIVSLLHFCKAAKEALSSLWLFKLELFFWKKTTLCKPCLFDKDIHKFSDDFLKLNKSSKISKIFHNFASFYRKLNYWNSVNKRVVDDYFELLNVEKHYLCKHFWKICNGSCFV